MAIYGINNYFCTGNLFIFYLLFNTKRNFRIAFKIYRVVTECFKTAREIYFIMSNCSCYQCNNNNIK